MAKIPNNQGDPIRKEFNVYLKDDFTHISLENAAKGFPVKFINAIIPGVPYTPWALLEHIRLTQKDMLDFIGNPKYKVREWPKGYWPAPSKKATASDWKKTLDLYRKDSKDFQKIIADAKNDLNLPIANGDGQTIAKEVLQVIDHASYHTGELVLMRRVLGIWKK
jgi:hypothetical protein